MKFQDFENMRLAIKVNGFTPWQLILLYSEVVGRMCDFPEFEDVKKELSDMEEALVETKDKYDDAQAAPRGYEPDPADLAREKEEA